MKTAFEILQSKLTIADTSEFREIHIPEILDAMEEYKSQLPQQEISDEEIENLLREHWGFSDVLINACRWFREQIKQK